MNTTLFQDHVAATKAVQEFLKADPMVFYMRVYALCGFDSRKSDKAVKAISNLVARTLLDDPTREWEQLDAALLMWHQHLSSPTPLSEGGGAGEQVVSPP